MHPDPDPVGSGISTNGSGYNQQILRVVQIHTGTVHFCIYGFFVQYTFIVKQFAQENCVFPEFFK